VSFVKTLPDSQGTRAGSAANGGFSLIEVLVAALLLLVIALGLIPLFTRAMIDNASGRDSTTATNIDRTQLESLAAMPFDSSRLLVTNGQEFIETEESFSRGDPKVDNDSAEIWTAGVPSNLATVRWTRRTRVRQYQWTDVKKGVFATPRVGGTNASFVQLKDIEVAVQGANRSAGFIGNVLGGSPELTFRLKKAY
jgi:prepilin-type N-terminal cleavage/methylation domain-containing protein